MALKRKKQCIFKTIDDIPANCFTEEHDNVIILKLSTLIIYLALRRYLTAHRKHSKNRTYSKENERCSYSFSLIGSLGYHLLSYTETLLTIVGIPIDTNCAPIVAGLFLSKAERLLWFSVLLVMDN